MAEHSYQGVGTTGIGRGRLRSSTSGPGQEAPRAELARRLEQITRVTLRPVASPMALGFLALMGASVSLASLQLGWIPATEGRNVAIVLIAFVAPLQLVAAVFGLLARDGAAATAMGVLTGTWLTVGLVTLTSPPGSQSDALAILLLTAAVAMLVPALGASRGKVVPTLVFSGAALRFATAGVFQITASTAWARVTGWIGVALALLAFYAALAAGLEDAAGRTVLPMGRRRRGRESLEGGLAEQVLDVAHEPGVRRQL